MILPTALVDRWPGDEYKQQHKTIESALKHNVADALQLYKDIKILKCGHMFHKTCYEEWLAQYSRYDNKICMICRYEYGYKEKPKMRNYIKNKKGTKIGVCQKNYQILSMIEK